MACIYISYSVWGPRETRRMEEAFEHYEDASKHLDDIRAHNIAHPDFMYAEFMSLPFNPKIGTNSP